MRLVGTSVECFRYLEPLFNDYRKIRIQNKDGSMKLFLINQISYQIYFYNLIISDFEILHMDEFVDELLRAERYCDVILPRIQVKPPLQFPIFIILITSTKLEYRKGKYWKKPTR